MSGEKPFHPCAAPLCPNVCAGRYCDEHVGLAAQDEADRAKKQALIDRLRGSASKRGYDRKWSRFALAFLNHAENRLCRRCLEKGLVVPAVLLHHRLPLAERPDLKYEPSNLEPLCNACHEAVERRAAREGEGT